MESLPTVPVNKSTPAFRPWPSPRFLLTRALAIGVLFLLLHLAGLREYTTFLSGTSGAGAGLRLSFFYGSLYILSYLGAIVLAPIMIIAAGILVLWQKIASKQGSQ